MLRKLLKHEFRATGRVMLPLYLVVLLTSLFANLSIRFGLDAGLNPLVTMLYVLVMMAFVIALVSVCIITLVLMVRRFYKNLLGDEGYIMFTLPASVHQHVWSKLIVSVVWFAATAAVVSLAILILAFDVSFVHGIVDVMEFVLKRLDFYYAFNGAAIVAEVLTVAFLSCAVTCLQFYAALSIGHSFSGRKMLLSVVFFFVLQFAMQMIVSAVTFGPGAVFMDWLEEAIVGWPTNGGAMASFHLLMLVSALTTLLHGGVYYFLTAFTLRRRLNLE